MTEALRVPSGQDVLCDREARWHERRALVAQHGQPVGTLSLNIPGVDKNLPGTAEAVHRLGEQWQERLRAEGLTVVESLSHAGADGPALHMVVRGGAEALKRCAIALEQATPLGRLADADVLDAHGEPVGREQLGLPPRSCLLCDLPAAVCVRARQHALADVMAEVERLLF